VRAGSTQAAGLVRGESSGRDRRIPLTTFHEENEAIIGTVRSATERMERAMADLLRVGVGRAELVEMDGYVLKIVK
jgi:hypothetical protein